MALDVVVLDDDYKYIKHIHIDKGIHGLLFKKLVTPKDYPSLGKAQNDQEDITFKPEDVPSLIADIDKLDAYIDNKAKMSDDVKERGRKFTASLRDLCEAALKAGKNVEFVAGD